MTIDDGYGVLGASNEERGTDPCLVFRMESNALVPGRIFHFVGAG
jgi:hypothetical protein